MQDSSVDVLRLSIIVRNNLEKEADGQEYHGASSAGAPRGDVKLNHTDAELDFEEQATDTAGKPYCHSIAVGCPAVTAHCLLLT